MELFGLKGNFGFLQQLNLCPSFSDNLILLLFVGGVLSALKSAPGVRKQAVGEYCLGIRQEATESLQVLVHLLC